MVARAGTGASQELGESDLAEAEGQVEELLRRNEALAKEKTTLLEAYEDLEEDTGRLVDEALLKQRRALDDLRLQVAAKEAALAEEEAARRDLEQDVLGLQVRGRMGGAQG